MRMCCGQRRKGNFCGDCGRPLHSVAGLIAWMKKSILQRDRMVKVNLAKVAKHEEGTPERRELDQRTAAFARELTMWKDWLASVEALAAGDYNQNGVSNEGETEEGI